MTRINSAVLNLQNPAGNEVSTPDSIREVSEVKSLLKVWGKAISATDSHARKCRRCNTRKCQESVARLSGALATVDPYQPCHLALELWETERKAMSAFRAAGGLREGDRHAF